MRAMLWIDLRRETENGRGVMEEEQRELDEQSDREEPRILLLLVIG